MKLFGFLLGMFRGFRRQLIIIGIILVVVVGLYFYITNMKNSINDLRQETGTQTAIIEFQKNTIKQLKSTIEKTNKELKELGERNKKHEQKITEIKKKFESGSVRKGINKEKEKKESEINKDLNNLFNEVIDEPKEKENAK